jgi:hypothetical protein
MDMAASGGVRGPVLSNLSSRRSPYPFPFFFDFVSKFKWLREEGRRVAIFFIKNKDVMEFSQ